MKDTATLSGGYFETGSITFTLYYNGGSSPVDTETVTVSGNGTYTTPTGFTLAITGTVTGTYQWDATYSGDTNNNSVSDNNAVNEQVTVSAANPTLTTSPTPTTVTLGANSVILTDSATLADGYHPTGTLTFTLFHNGGSTAVDTETVTVSGNGTYTTPTGFTLLSGGMVIGTYQWDASYSGDTNNNTVSDNNATNEQVTVGAEADLDLSKQVSPAEQLQGFNVTYTFILHNNGPSAATDVTVTDPFPSSLTVVGPNTPSQGTFDPAADVWSVGTLVSGATATLTVTARIDVLGPITNTASATADQFDPDLSNNTSSVSITGQMPPDQISKRFFLSGAAALDPAAAPVAVAADPPASASTAAADPPAATSAQVAALSLPSVPTAAAPAAATASSVSPVSNTLANGAAPATNSPGSRTNLLSGGGGEAPVTPAPRPPTARP